MLKKIIIVFVILASISFLNLIFIPASLIPVLQIVAVFICLLFIVLHAIYDDGIRLKKIFTIELTIIFITVLLSMLGAFYFHDQKFQTTAIAQRAMYFLLFYFLLHSFKINTEILIKTFVIISIAIALLYIIQTIVFPIKLFSVEIFKDRQTLRFFLPGTGYMVVTYFLYLGKTLESNNYKYITVCLLMLIVFIMMGTRQIIASTLLVTIIALITSQKIHSKILFTFIILLSIIPIYLLFKDIILAIFEVSKLQSANIKSYIRIKAALFYLFDFSPSKATFILGNGESSSNSSYGLQVQHYGIALGYFLSDIGIIGEYVKFGILFVMAELSIFLRISFMKLSRNLGFIKHSIYVIILTILVGQLLSTAGGIVLTCIVLYIVEVDRNSLIPKKTENNEQFTG